MNLVFMGTPDFAVGCLESILAAGHTVQAVFSQPDKPVGRKQMLTPPAVKQCAQKHGLPIYQPATLKDGEAERILDELAPDCVVVVAYGKLIPASMLSKPKYGYINVHASILPEYRGAAPIQWAIVDGKKETGVCTMQLDEGMDTGDILECKTLAIGENETAGELFDRLSALGAELIVSTLQKCEEGTLTPIKQDETKATYAAIITKDMAQIDFSKSATDIHNLVRGFSPWPIAYTTYEGKRLKVYRTAVSGATEKPSGTVIASQDKLIIACGERTSIELLEVQSEGAKRMSIADWLKGHSVPVGTQF